MRKIKLENIGLTVIVLGLIISWFWGSFRNDHVLNNGVYTIMTIDQVGGRTATMYYYYMGVRYTGGATPYRGGVGTRHFMMILPYKPKRKLIIGVRVPSWFTLDAPPEGWVNLPKDEDLRKMMVADSISRGLKVADTLSKE